MTDPTPWFPGESEVSGARRHAPATLRNRAAIAEVLAPLLPASGTVVEVASGSGEHCAYLAERFPAVEWWPSDPDAQARASIDAWCEGAANVRAALALDAMGRWPHLAVDVVWCANMLHIAPWEATRGLAAGAAAVLAAGGRCVLYGPFVRDGVATAESNRAFDRSLRSRDPEWGLRRLEAVNAVFACAGFAAERVVAMPANNLLVAFRRGA